MVVSFAWAALAALGGCCALLLLPALPPHWVWWSLCGFLLCALVLAWITARRSWVLLLILLPLIGVGFAAQLAWRAEATLSQRLLPTEQGQAWTVDLVLRGLPNQSQGAYPVWMTEAELLTGPRPGALLSLAWANPPKPLVPGQIWRVPVRLKNFSGTRNFHGFDPETWAFGKGLMLQGSVRAGRRDPPAALLGHDLGLFSRIDRLRYETRALIEETLADREHWGVMSGLVVGDQAVISAEHWTLFAQTGISHLVSISGMHVTLFAVAARVAAGLLWRALSAPPLRLALWVPFPPVGAIVAGLAAMGYALLAGFNLPAQRTAVMVCTAALATLAGQRLGTFGVLGITLLVMLALEPTAPLAPGFWLSFIAVWLLFAQPTEPQPGEGRERRKPTRWQRGWAALRSAAKAQWAMTVGLAPLTVAFFHQISVVGPLANAVAIPVVTYLVTPLALLGAPLAAMGWIAPLQWAEGLFAHLMVMLEWMASGDWAVASWHAPPLWASLLACGGVIWALQPPRPDLSPWVRRLGWALVLALGVGGQPVPKEGEVEVTALDVGQGTAVLIRTRSHTMLYDTGPTMGASTAARRVVLPQMQAEGLRALDLLMVSHDDDDHASGLSEVMAAFPSAHLVTSLQPHELEQRGRPSANPGQVPSDPGLLRCEWGVGWAWNGVQFRVLYPYADRRLEPRSGNDDSCVLEVTDAAGRRLILAGDLSSQAEADWLSQQPWLAEPRGPLLLMAPHHGSRGSLSEDTLETLKPDWVFAQSRFQGRFQHPHPEVVERLASRGIPFLRTDLQGALRLHWQGGSLVTQAASDQRRFWHLLRDPAAVHVPGHATNLIGRGRAEEDR